MNKKMLNILGALMLVFGIIPILLTPILLFIFKHTIAGFLIILFYYVLNFICLICSYNNKRTDIQTKITWTAIEFMLPGIGAYIYYCFARMPKKLLKKYNDSSLLQNEILKKTFTNSNLTLFTNGKDKFKNLFNDIKNAKKYINIEYFILNSGKLFDELVNLVSLKSKEGIQIRILFDYLGSISLSNKEILRLKNAGAFVYHFKKINWFFPSGIDNWRTHNKIVVIDGNIVYFGGMNFSDEYIKKDWIDIHFKGEGEIANSFDTLFLTQWKLQTNEDITKLISKTNLKIENNDKYKLHNDLPQDEIPKIFNLIKEKIRNSKKTIKIITPYISIPVSLKDTIRDAIHRGIKISIITAGSPENYFAYYQGAFDVETLTDIGVKVYRYKNNFIHSKLYIFDDKTSLFGTTNLDYRAFFQNYEYLVETNSNLTEKLINYFNDIKGNSEINKIYRKDWWFGRHVMYTIIRMFKGLF